jgi:CubicO group peptidase (beta-lactamase class C family)
MLRLYEQGKWQLDDPVTKFIPEFADLQVLQDGTKLVPLDRPMTMRHLMASSAGFAFGPGLGTTDPEVDDIYTRAGLWSGTNDEMITKLAKLPLESQPGPSSATASNKKCRAQSCDGSPASNSTPCYHGSSSIRLA